MAQPKKSTPDSTPDSTPGSAPESISESTMGEQKPAVTKTAVDVATTVDTKGTTLNTPKAAEPTQPRQEQATVATQAQGPAYPPVSLRQTRGYDQSDVETIEVDSEGEACDGDLIVFAFRRRDDKQATFDNAREQPLSGVQVKISGQNLFDSQETDNEGKVHWRDLAAGSYTLLLSPPLGYQALDEKVRNGDDAQITVEVKEGEATVCDVGFTLAEMYLRGFCYHDLNRNSDPTGQPRLKGIMLDVFHGDERIDCIKSSDYGIFELAVRGAAVLALEAPATIKVGGCRLQPAFAWRMMAQPQSSDRLDDDCMIALPFITSQAEILVEACFMPKAGANLPLPGVTFTLHRGTSAGTPVLQSMTTGLGRSAVTFTELDSGLYTIVANWPQLYQGQTLEPVQAGGQRQQVTVMAGQAFGPVRFCFKPCRARVTGRVLDDGCGAGLAGVPLLLTAVDGQSAPQEIMTGATGEFDEAIAQGEYILGLAQDKVRLRGKDWVIREGSLAEQRIKVGASGLVQAPEFRLEEDIHKVHGFVLTPEEEPVPYAVVEILDEAQKHVITLAANEKGYYEYIAPRAGIYHLNLRQENGQPAQLVPVVVNSTFFQNLIANSSRRGPQSIAVNATGAFKESVGDLTAYPLLTEEVSSVATSRTSSNGGTSQLGQIVDGALRDVLSWRPKSSDVKGFLAALNQSFEITEVQGHTEWKWTPRSYAVQLDMGAITGAQASIYSRAKAALDQSLPLLDGLYPLLPDADDQDVEANRAIVESNLNELVRELGMEGGPRVQRVDALFESLLGINPLANAAFVNGQLGLLREEFGLTADRVNTVAEEQNLTNFFILFDHTFSLKLSWDAQRAFFDRVGPEVFLGTQLVLVSRVLAVVAESVQETYFAMGSVFLGEAEQQTVRLDYANAPSLFVRELLEWVRYTAEEEGARLIRDGGKAGIIALYPTVKKLLALVQGALIPPQDPNRLPAGYRTVRVQRALSELADHLQELNDLIIEFVPQNQR